MRIVTTALIFVLFSTAIFAAIENNVPQILTQPDGTVLNLLASGDEFCNYLHDEKGYTIVQHPETGYYVYAVPDGAGLKASDYSVGRYNPETLLIQPGLRPDPETFRSLAASRNRSYVQDRFDDNTGNLNNLVVFIRFADDTDFPADFTHSYYAYNNLLNDSNVSQPSLANYFRFVSDNRLNVTSYLYPASPNGATILSYQDIFDRSYYTPYSTTNPDGYTFHNKTTREDYLLFHCMQWLLEQNCIDWNLDWDKDNDGRMDNVTFIVRGTDTGWNSILWPHKWYITSPLLYTHGLYVQDYNLLMETNNQASIYCHELSHTLGYPDLYHYYYAHFDAVSSWDIMNSHTQPPQLHLAYMEYKYGHYSTEPQVITAPGTYTLSPRSQSRYAAYKIATSVPNQFYLLEYRKQEGLWESQLDSSGLLVYRINTAYNGNSEGPPDEVYVFRPGGSLTENGVPELAALGTQTSRQTFISETSFGPFFTDGTADPNLIITEVVEGENSITFTLRNTRPHVWKGSSTDWNTASNWIGGVPTATDDAIIPGCMYYYPQITSGTEFTCNNLIVDHSGSIGLYGGTLHVLNNARIFGSVSLTSSTGTFDVTGALVFDRGGSMNATHSNAYLSIKGSLIFKIGHEVNLTNGYIEFTGSGNSNITVYQSATLNKLGCYKNSGYSVNYYSYNGAELTLNSHFYNFLGTTFNCYANTT